jgi:HAD superfamily hydrolase (TIGR01662 family)
MIRAVLFDRDGTLIADSPRDRSRVMPMPGAPQALQRLRAHDIRIGVVTNQPAIADGDFSYADLCETNDRIENVLGKIDGWFVCPHAENAGCTCRKPQPGLIQEACRRFEVSANECVMVGDIGSDIDAAINAGVNAILVPTPITRAEEIARAPVVCADLDDAVDRILEAVPVS